MRMRKKKGRALLFAVALLTGILPVGTTPVSKAEETSASAGKYGLKNPVVKAVSPPANTSHGLSNPRNENGTVTWDCVYFGNYWQNDTNGDGVADKNDEKEPIKWRVLSVDGDDAFLLADTNLDVQRYNDTDENVTWETCTMRSWLNGYGANKNVCGNDYSDNNFLDNAFTELEQAAIRNTVVVNEDSSNYGTEGGKDTVDKIYLLSVSEVMNPLYGFLSIKGVTEIREAVNTVYGAAQGKNITGHTDDWWLRSPGHDSDLACCVGVYGDGYVNQDGAYAYYNLFAVRPALHLNLSSDLEWKKAESVSSDGGEMITTWDCIWFGNYPQSDATGVTKEPIKWRVLSVDGDEAFLLADKNLDVQRYNDTEANITWETCTMRSWLNGYNADKNQEGVDYSINNFINNAFTISEQKMIQDTIVVSEDNLECGTEGGNNTIDKIYLLSLSEVMNLTYGFSSTMYATETRNAINTAYVAEGGEIGYDWTMSNAERTDPWWLRTPGQYSYAASDVRDDGLVSSLGASVYISDRAVRPALHLNLLNNLEWSYAGTVTSTGEKEEVATSNSPVPPFPSTGGSSVVGISSITQNPAAVTSPAPAQNTSVAGQEEVQKTDGKTTLAQVTGLKLKAKKKAIEVSWKKVSGATGYEIQVSTSKKFTKKSTKTTKKMKLIIGKLKQKKKYFVRVRTYRVVNGKKTYGKWSKITNIKTKK